MVIGEVSAYDYARGLGNNDRIEDCSNFYDWFCSDSAQIGRASCRERV